MWAMGALQLRTSPFASTCHPSRDQKLLVHGGLVVLKASRRLRGSKILLESNPRTDSMRLESLSIFATFSLAVNSVSSIFQPAKSFLSKSATRGDQQSSASKYSRNSIKSFSKISPSNWHRLDAKLFLSQQNVNLLVAACLHQPLALACSGSSVQPGLSAKGKERQIPMHANLRQSQSWQSVSCFGLCGNSNQTLSP